MKKNHSKSPKPVESYKQPGQRVNLPTDQTEAYMEDEDKEPVKYTPNLREHKGRPALAWDRKADDAESVWAYPLYIQEKIHPGAFVNSLAKLQENESRQGDLFNDFNGLPENASYEWYEHQGYWQNRIIKGPNREIMASLLAKENMGGTVQMIFFDPPYGISYKANMQADTRNREPKSGDKVLNDRVSCKAFRDTYERGIHSYLDVTRQTVVLARDLLAEEGSFFMQIGKANVHRLAVLLDEIFGEENRVATITFAKTGSTPAKKISEIADYLLWYAKNKKVSKFHQIYEEIGKRQDVVKKFGWGAMLELKDGTTRTLTKLERENPDKEIPEGALIFERMPLLSQNTSTTGLSEPYEWNSKTYTCNVGHQWRVKINGMDRLAELNRLDAGESGELELRWKLYEFEYPGTPINNIWSKSLSPNDMHYVVETAEKVIERCILMTTDPGDIVLDPTCGSGTSAFVAEKWGRRWITIDAASVAVSLARQRLATGIFPYHLLLDSSEGQTEEYKLNYQLLAGSNDVPKFDGGHGHDIRKGFVYERVATVSAGILAYDKNVPPTLLVDRTKKKPGVIRVASPFTVESHNPHQVVNPELALHEDLGDAGLVENIIKALEKSGVRSGKQKLQISDIQPIEYRQFDPFGVTHIAKIDGEDAGVVIAPEDCTVTRHMITRAANSCLDLSGGRIRMLLIVGFAFEVARGEQIERRGKLTIYKAQANQDLRIAELKDSEGDQAFVHVGEPDITVESIGDNGQLICKVNGYDTYDPRTGQLKIGGKDEIACWMLDTNYDGESFFAKRIHFPGAARDNQIKNFARKLGSRIEKELWENTLSCISAPFDRPQTGQVAVRIITCTHTELTAEIDV